MNKLPLLFFTLFALCACFCGTLIAQQTAPLETIKVYKCIQSLVVADSLKNKVFHIASVAYVGDDRCNAIRLFAINHLNTGEAIHLDGNEVLHTLSDICDNCEIRTVTFSVAQVKENWAWLCFTVR
jgi:hypothetical protein